MSKKTILNLIEKYKIYMMIFIITSPIFISLDFSQGIKFDAYYFNQYIKPSIPLSSILIAILSFINIKRLIVQKDLMILIVLIFVYIGVNFYYGTTRAVIVGIGMILPILTYYIFKDYIKNIKINYNVLYTILFIVIVLKLIFDIYIYQLCIFRDELYSGQDIQKTIFSTPFYITIFMAIYSYYDYFPFIYYLAIVLSLQNIINKLMIKRSIILIIISLIVVQDTGSRLFIYGIYLIPLLWVFYKITNFKLSTYFYLFIFVSISVTLFIGLVDFKVTDVSLLARYKHAHAYFNNFRLINLLLPFLNSHRLETSGSLHNELLEIFSFFGFVSIYYYYLIKNMFANVKNKYKFTSYLLMFIILIGALIQINLPNPYVGIMLGFVLAVISIKDKEVIYEK